MTDSLTPQASCHGAGNECRTRRHCEKRSNTRLTNNSDKAVAAIAVLSLLPAPPWLLSLNVIPRCTNRQGRLRPVPVPDSSTKPYFAS